MLKDVFLISRVLIKNSFSLKMKKKDLLMYIIVYMSLLISTCFFCFVITTSLATIGMEKIALDIIFAVVLGISIFQNIISSINMLFFSKDIEKILSLPITAGKLYICKFNCLLFTEYLSNLIFFMPALITYGIVLKLGILYYFYTFIAYLMFPILPLTFVIFIMALLMRFTKVIRNKDIIQYISVAISIVLIVFALGLSQDLSGDISTEKINNILIPINQISQNVSNLFVTIKPTINALINYNNIEGFKNICILAIETIIGYTISYFLIKRLLLKIILNINLGTTRSKSIKGTYNYKQKKVKSAYMKKEFLMLFRNPVYCMQCLLPSIFIPFFILCPLVIALNKGGKEAVDILTVFNTQNTALGLCVRLVILQCLYAINFVSITSISREGEDVLFLKLLPIRYEKQISYKAQVGVLSNIAPIIIFIIFDFYITKVIQLTMLLMLFITGVFSSIFFNYVLVIIDLKHPKLGWENEYAVVKQNINLVFGLFISAISCIIIMFSIIIAKSIYVYFIELCLLFLVLIISIKIYIRKNIDKLFKRLEV